MSVRVVTSVVAVVMVVGLVALAVLGGGPGGGPQPLPVLGAAADGELAAADMSALPVSEYRVDGEVAELDGEAQAWSLGRAADQARIATLAEAFGLDGDVATTDVGWEVAGVAGRLEVQRQPGLPWSYTGGAACGNAGEPEDLAAAHGECGGVSIVEDPAPGLAQERIDCDMPECPPGMACTQVCPPDGADGSAEPMPVPEPGPPAGLPSAEEARRIGLDLLAATGLDVDDADVRVEDQFSSWGVTADPMVGGLPTVGIGSWVAVGPEGAVESANGWLADPAAGDRYPLIGTTAAVERLAEEQGVGAGGTESPFEPVLLTDVRLGLAHLPAHGADESWLVPSYLFTIDGQPDGVLPVIALGDEHLEAAPASEPEVPDGCELVGGDAVACPDEGLSPDDPVSSDDLAGPAPEGTTAVATTTDGRCLEASRESLQVEVCLSADPAPGEPVTFDVVATDAAEAIADDCASPLFWADGSDAGEMAVCDIGFAPAPGAGPAVVRRSFTHAFDTVGDHEVRVSVNRSCVEACRPFEVVVPVAVAP
jgi:hypothetical protein